MSDYVPKDEAGKINWLTNLAAWLMANGLSHGFTAMEISQFNSLSVIAAQSVAPAEAKQAEARAAIVTKRTAIGNAVALGRETAQRLQSHPATTDAERAAAGLTVPDTIPTQGGGLPGVELLPPPNLVLDFSIRRQVTIHWGVLPANEHQNHRPAGTIGCEIQYARGGIPSDESQWQSLDTDTDSPFTHFTNETAPTTYAYRARYVGKRLKHGSFCDPVVCTVSV